MIERSRRLRQSDLLRRTVRETRLSAASLIYPIFLVEGENKKEAIPSMPGQYRFSLDRVGKVVKEHLEVGVSAFMLFGIPDHKDEEGSGAWQADGIVQRGIQSLRREFGRDIILYGDVCLCEYTSHGHCGLIQDGEVLNDETVARLAKVAVSQAEAGVDVIAPSDMMDGRIGAIRAALDEAGFEAVAIMSYAVKYASAFYGPFREAAGSTPAFGDRKSYQMDWHNRREAAKEAAQDLKEGADMIMVKPALAYGDIISDVKQSCHVPVAAYSVSGEYAMIKTAAQAGLVDEQTLICETAVAAYRAGADLYISYFAKEIAGAMAAGRIG